MSKEICFLAQQVLSEAGPYQDFHRNYLARVTATLSSIEESDILTEFTPQEILQHHDKDAFLELIGEDYAREYFGIESADGTEG